MSILVNKNTNIIVQGFTGKEGTFHSAQMIEYGTNILGGVTPGKEGQIHLGKPVFNTVKKAIEQTGAESSIIFVPPNFSKDAILEAIDASLQLIVVITEGIPINDMVKIRKVLDQSSTILIGPNCPGIITPDESKLGIMPGSIFKKGSVGIVSKSGTLTYEASDQIIKEGLGISTAVGVGGDPVLGTDVKKIVQLMMKDPQTKCIVIIGEIGGSQEIDAAIWIKEEGNKKPVVSFVAGETCPKGRTMGHEGAIIDIESETAGFKKKIMKQCGVHIVDSPSDIGKKVLEVLS